MTLLQNLLLQIYFLVWPRGLVKPGLPFDMAAPSLLQIYFLGRPCGLLRPGLPFDMAPPSQPQAQNAALHQRSTRMGVHELLTRAPGPHRVSNSHQSHIQQSTNTMNAAMTNTMTNAMNDKYNECSNDREPESSGAKSHGKKSPNVRLLPQLLSFVGWWLASLLLLRLNDPQSITCFSC